MDIESPMAASGEGADENVMRVAGTAAGDYGRGALPGPGRGPLWTRVSSSVVPGGGATLEQAPIDLCR